MSDRLGMAEIARLLGVSRPRAWQLRRQPDFPEPFGRDGGRDFWFSEQILRWAAASGRGLAEHAPVLYRPAGDQPTHFEGGRVESGQPMLVWDTPLGRIAIVYPAEAPWPVPVADLIDRNWLDVAVQTRPGWGLTGPDLHATDAARPDLVYEPEWADLARVLGQPAPWWPDGLGRPEEIIAWRPGTCREVEPETPVDLRPLQEISDRAEPGSSIAATMRALTADIRDAAALGPNLAVKYINDLDPRHRAHIHLAAIPLNTATPNVSVPEDVRRDAWAQILQRTDDLAYRCVRVARQWDSGQYFPCSGIADLTPTPSTIAGEWASQLQPSDETAGHYVVDSDRTARQYLQDPRTDMPAALRANGDIRAAVPQRLPAFAPLAELIMSHHEIFIRTDDGRLYLAPEAPGYGLSWGYGGSGPTQLAGLIDTLLADITAATPGHAGRTTVPPGLLELTAHDWPDGTVHTRADLERARAGR